MRSKRKMETVRIRKANATIKKEKGADGKVTVAFVPEITRYKVICDSNGKLVLVLL